MRKPTPEADAYAWHRAALAGQAPPIHGHPEAGWYKRRLVKGGPIVAARIWIHSPIDPETGELIGPEIFLCEVAGQARDAQEEWTWLAYDPISKAQYDYLVADAAWARRNKPDDPAANPRQPIDHLQTEIPY